LFLNMKLYAIFIIKLMEWWLNKKENIYIHTDYNPHNSVLSNKLAFP